MEIGQVNIAANQVAPERQTQGQAPAVEKPSERPDGELARVLAGDDIGDAVSRPRELRLTVDQELEQVIARVVDSETGETVRTIPPDELVEAAKRLRALLGQMLDREV